MPDSPVENGPGTPWSTDHRWDDEAEDTSDGVYGARPEVDEGECSVHPNAPIPDSAMAGRLRHYQEIVDRGRRIPARHGLRPYRVFLVWREREADRDWVTIDEVELQPAKLYGLDGQTLAIGPAGDVPMGAVMLRDVSSAQVDEPTLRGLRNGQEWAGSNRQFFYEVRLRSWTEGDAARPRRLTPQGPPEYSGRRFGWKVVLTEQLDPREQAAEGNPPRAGEVPRRRLRY